jgi:uncharacterized membrane protein YebE (DUF533 family)
LNDPTRLLSIFLGGALGRSGRKRARRAAHYIGGHKGFVSASTLLAAAGVAWGIYDSLKAATTSSTPAAPGTAPASGASVAPPLSAPPLPPTVPDDVLRIVRLAVSAARADGALTPDERGLILDHARRAGVESAVETELAQPHPLADIVRGLTDPAHKRDLYVLAFSIVRADETVSGSERIYLAQLAHQLDLDPAAVARLEEQTAERIDQSAP